jgi:hypothetical protein
VNADRVVGAESFNRKDVGNDGISLISEENDGVIVKGWNRSSRGCEVDDGRVSQEDVPGIAFGDKGYEGGHDVGEPKKGGHPGIAVGSGKVGGADGGVIRKTTRGVSHGVGKELGEGLVGHCHNEVGIWMSKGLSET